MDMAQSSSVMFSLQELERMEEDRVRTLADAAQREHVLRERARREDEERTHVERRAQERAEDEARREVERRAREEAARIEAIHRATTEAARLEVEAKTRAEARELERRHELELERARVASAGAGKARGTLVAALFGAAVAAGVAMATHYGVVAPREHTRATEDEAAIASRDVAIANVRAHAEAMDARVRALEDEAAAARGENDRLRAELYAAHRQPAPLNPTPRGPGVAPRLGVPKLDGFTSCPPGSKDPMCLP
jgi:colicin import membrane protein